MRRSFFPPRALALAFGLACVLLGWRIGARGYSTGPRFIVLVGATLAILWGLLRQFREPSVPSIGSKGERRHLAAAGAVLIMWAACEGCLAILVRTYPAGPHRLNLMRPGDGPALLGREYFQRFYRNGFDAELGWDRPDVPPFGPARHVPLQYPTSLVSSYGDSYTQCMGSDEETWQTHLSAALGTTVINYGVRAYGPDQALLKLKRVHPRRRTPVVLFGYLSENVDRIVNVYRYACEVQRTGHLFPYGEPYFEPTKPRFTLEAGELRLLPNPVRNEQDLLRLVYEPGYAARLSNNDYFKRGYDPAAFVPEISFPYLLSLVRAVALRAAPREAPDYPLLLMQDPGTVRLLTAIVDEFYRYGEGERFLGVVVLFGLQDDLEYYLEHGRHKRLDPLVAHLQGKSYPYVDTIALLASHNKTMSEREPLSLYYDQTSHHSAYAHRLIAEGMAKQLEEYGRSNLWDLKVAFPAEGRAR